jgi:hypothetical protein
MYIPAKIEDTLGPKSYCMFVFAFIERERRGISLLRTKVAMIHSSVLASASKRLEHKK